MHMIGHDHIFINGNIPVKIIHFQQRLLRDNSVIRKADVWGVEDAAPYNTSKNVLLPRSADRYKIHAGLRIIICRQPKRFSFLHICLPNKQGGAFAPP